MFSKFNLYRVNESYCDSNNNNSNKTTRTMDNSNKKKVVAVES